MGRWQDDCRRRAYCAKRRNEVCNKKIPGALRIRTGGDEAGRGGAGCGLLYVAQTEYRKSDPTTPSPLSVGTPGDKRSGTVEDRFRRILERRRVESGEESMDDTLSEAGEEMEVGNTPEPKPAEEDFTTQELLKDLSGDDWADTATPPLNSSPRKNVELPLTSETSNIGMNFLSAEESEKNTFEGNMTMFLGTLDEKAWRDFLREINQETESEITLDSFKVEHGGEVRGTCPDGNRSG